MKIGKINYKEFSLLSIQYHFTFITDNLDRFYFRLEDGVSWWKEFATTLPPWERTSTIKLGGQMTAEVHSLLYSRVIHVLSGIEGGGETDLVREKVGDVTNVGPVVLDGVIYLEGDLTRKANGVDVEYIENYTNQRTLWTASRKISGRGRAISEAQDHLSVLEIAQDQSEEPLGDLKSNKNPHDDIVVYFIESLDQSARRLMAA